MKITKFKFTERKHKILLKAKIPYSAKDKEKAKKLRTDLKKIRQAQFYSMAVDEGGANSIFAVKNKNGKQGRIIALKLELNYSTSEASKMTSDITELLSKVPLAEGVKPPWMIKLQG